MSTQKTRCDQCYPYLQLAGESSSNFEESFKDIYSSITRANIFGQDSEVVAQWRKDSINRITRLLLLNKKPLIENHPWQSWITIDCFLITTNTVYPMPLLNILLWSASISQSIWPFGLCPGGFKHGEKDLWVPNKSPSLFYLVSRSWDSWESEGVTGDPFQKCRCLNRSIRLTLVWCF